MIRESFFTAEEPATHPDSGLSRVRREHRNALLLALGVLLGGLVLAFAAAHAFRQIEAREFETAFHLETDRYLNAIRHDLHATEGLLRGTAGFVAASEVVTAREWSSYVSRLNIDPAVSGILAIGYSQRVAPALRQYFEASMRAGGHPAFAISPPGERSDLQPITHIAPSDSANGRALGIDLLADPVLRRTIERARDTGELVLTPSVQRPGESEEQSQVVLMIQPVFLDSMPQETPDQRAQAFAGFAFMALRVDVLTRSNLPGLNAHRHVRIVDTTDNPARELFNSDASSPPQYDIIAATGALEASGRVWTLHVSDHARLESVLRGSAILLGSGIFTSLLLALLAWHLASARARAELLARRITRDLRQSEMGLRQSQALLSSVINSLPSAVLLKNESLEIQLANQAFCELGACNAADLIGRRVVDVFDPQLGQRLEADDLATLGSGDAQVSELVVKNSDGELRTYQVRKVRLPGSQLQVLAIYTDITDVRVQSRLIRALIDHLPQRFMVKDRESRFLLVNNKLADDFGLTPEEMRGRCDADFFPPELAARYRAGDRLVMESGEARVVEEPCVRGWLRTTKAALRDESSAVIGVVGLLDDVTERRAQEEQLREALVRFESVVESTPLVAIKSVDREGIVRCWNPACTALYGIGHEDAIGHPLAELIYSTDQRPDFETALARMFETGSGLGVAEWAFEMPSGRKIDVYSTMFPVIVGSEVREVFFMDVDISARRQAEVRLRESEARWQFALEGAGDGVWDWNLRNDRVEFSDRWKSMLGYRHEEIGNQLDEWSSRVHPDDLPVTMARVHAHLDGRTPDYVSEHRVRCKDGCYLWILDRGKVIERDADGKPTRMIGTHTDITERREMEAEVRRNRDLLDAINHLQDDFIRDPESNGVFENMLGWLLTNAGCEIGMIGEALTDADGSCFMRTLAVGKIVRDSETGLSRQEYAPHVLELRDSTTLFGAVLASDQPVISNDAANDPRAPKLLPGHPVLGNFAGLPIRSGKDLIGMVGLANRPVGFDAALVSELEPLLRTFGKLLLARRSEIARKQAEAELARHRDHLREMVDEQTSEARAARDEAQRANRVKSEFLANMSHELRTPMHAILSFAKLGEARTKKDGQSKLNDYFDRIRVSGDRLLNLLNDLLDLSKLEAGKMVLDLHHHAVGRLVREAAREFEGMFQAKGVQLRIHDAVTTPEIPVDKVRIGQVLRNLLSNAVKFSSQGRTVEIRLTACEMPLGRRRDDQGRTTHGVEVVISDEGVGIPESELERVFDKFVQSTKTRTGAGGTGLGLAICREIVEAHHGRVFARLNAKGGTDLVVQLPASPNAVVSNLFSQG